MKFRPCLSEAETVERAIAGANLARYGDGEFMLVIGRNCVSQRADKGLRRDLIEILDKAPSGCLPCLPDPYCGNGKSPKMGNWQAMERLSINLGQQEYGSAFITRPDTAPWIDTPEYWDRIRDLWRGKDVTLVIGSDRSLRPSMMDEAKSVRVVWGTYRDAYDSPGGDQRDNPSAARNIGQLMEAIGKPSGTVLLCLGPTATVLAARLAKIGVHGVDLGHLGMFMRSAGAYRLTPDDLLSPEYRALLNRAHKEIDWGGSGHKQADAVAQFAKELGAKAILDYGSGQGKLAQALAAATPPRRVINYDPGMGSVGLPKLTHLVVCSDVLEHVERDKLDNVLQHLHSLAALGAYFVIATRPANKSLPDGRNMHLIIETPEWWIAKVNERGWKNARPPVNNNDRSVTMWLLK